MITLSKRVMSPRNILNNIVVASPLERTLLEKAAKYFALACRPTVGYKQLMNYISVCITVELSPIVPKEVDVLDTILSIPKDKPNLLDILRKAQAKDQQSKPIVEKPVLEAEVDNDQFRSYRKVEEEVILSVEEFMQKVNNYFNQHYTINQAQVERILKKLYADYKTDNPERTKAFVIHVRSDFLKHLENIQCHYTQVTEFWKNTTPFPL